MKHKRWWCNVIYTEDCARCRIRQLTYGFRMDPYGYLKTRSEVMDDTKLTIQERLYVISHTRNITIEE